jgi:hypothetical protein
MSDDLQNLNDEEKLKAENEFLKLKLCWNRVHNLEKWKPIKCYPSLNAPPSISLLNN